MMLCAYTFATLASRYERAGGVIDYAEMLVGERYAYAVGWFLSTVYYPSMASVVAWSAARYTLALFGNGDSAGGLCISLAAFYMVLSYAVNVLSPRIAGKLQVTTTAVKLVPLVVMAVVGTIAGIVRGGGAPPMAMTDTPSGTGVFGAVISAAFAYEGWIIATSINSEIRDSKRNLPRALIFGTLAIIFAYVLFFIGLSGAASADELIKFGVTRAFVNLFGRAGGTALNALIVVSCLGALNGLMLASTRSTYALAVRGQGPSQQLFSEVSRGSNMPVNSGVVGLLVTAAWFFYYYGANVAPGGSVFGLFTFDSSELPIVTVYAAYIPIFVALIVRDGKRSIFKNALMPSLAIAASLFMVFAAIWAHGILPYRVARESGAFALPILFYGVVLAAVMALGMLFYCADEKREKALKKSEKCDPV
jgi:APA family basic amino acid/polyamine antiporter